MNKSFVVFCTPDVYRPTACRAIQALKNTHIPGVELVLVDNCYDDNFRHSEVMQTYLDYADGAPIVFMDDDVLIKDKDWLLKLNQCAIETGASIVGCIHTYSTGEINHTGIMAYNDGSTELMNEDINLNQNNRFVPALSSALMLITNSRKVVFDTKYRKYQHDSDICLSAWRSGYKVACANNLSVIHDVGGYMRTKSCFRNVLEDDSLLFKKKWGFFLKNEAYDIPELASYKITASGFNWENLYNEASRISDSSPDKSLQIFQNISTTCPSRTRRAGAYFHIYLLNKRIDNLYKCLDLNPNHMLAKELLEQYGDL